MHVLDITMPSTTPLRVTSYPDTVSYAGNLYAPFPLVVNEERVSGDNQLPTLSVAVSNYAGIAYRFLKENDLTHQQVTVRLISTLSNSGDETKARFWIRGVTFAQEIENFDLGFSFNLEAEGPRRI